MKWLDSGLPALLGFGFLFAFADTAIEEGSISAAWFILGQDLVRWGCIAIVVMAGWFIWRLASKPREGA